MLEEPFRLIDWGLKCVTKDKNAGSIALLEKLVVHYSPQLIIVPELSPDGSQQSARTQRLIHEMTAMVLKKELVVQATSRTDIWKYFRGEATTKHELAILLAERFPEELGAYLPHARRPWMSEDNRMNIFVAVALAIVGRSKHRTQKRRETQ